MHKRSSSGKNQRIGRLIVLEHGHRASLYVNIPRGAWFRYLAHALFWLRQWHWDRKTYEGWKEQTNMNNVFVSLSTFFVPFIMFMFRLLCGQAEWTLPFQHWGMSQMRSSCNDLTFPTQEAYPEWGLHLRTLPFQHRRHGRRSGVDRGTQYQMSPSPAHELVKIHHFFGRKLPFTRAFDHI